MKKLLIVLLIIAVLTPFAYFGYKKYASKSAEQKQDKKEQKLGSDSTLVSVDAKFNEYTNTKLGFKVLVPKQVRGQWAEYQSQKNCVNPVPVVVIEDKEVIYVQTRLYFDFDADECKTATLEYLKALEHGIPFAYHVRDIKNDDELLAFIKDRYGKDCKLGDKKSWAKQNGVFEVEIAGVVPLDSKKDCIVNYQTFLYYHPAKNKAISYDQGQAYNFYDPVDYNKDYPDSVFDDEMIDSLRFL